MSEAAAPTPGKRAIWGWYFFDWAGQPFHTLLITFIFAPYFTSAVAANDVAGQAQWGYMMAAASLIIAITAPIFGAVADSSGPRKPFIAVFIAMVVVGSAYLWFATPGMSSVTLILIAFALGLIGLSLAEAFVNAMIPSLASREDAGLISGNGWAFGYWGGLLSLVIMMLLFAENEEGKTFLGNAPALGLDAETRQGTRFVGPFVALWTILFLIPFFLFVPDVPRRDGRASAIVGGLKELMQTIRRLPENISFAAYLGSSMFYRDALNGVYAFGGIYAAGVLGWSIIQIGIFGIVAALTGAIFCYAGAIWDKAIGPKKVITWCNVTLILVCVVIIGTTRDSFLGIALGEGSTMPDRIFMLCGAVIGAAGGILQASSRTFLIDQADPNRITEAFGLYALSGRATTFLAPGLIAVVTDITQNQRLGLTPVILLFLIGLALLFWVRSAPQYE